MVKFLTGLFPTENVNYAPIVFNSKNYGPN